MTINGLQDLKQIIDRKCEGASIQLRQDLIDNEEVPEGVMICYHNHFNNIRFSIFTTAKGLSTTQSINGVAWDVENGIDIRTVENIQSRMEVLLNEEFTWPLEQK